MKEVQVLAWCDGCADEIGTGDGQVERSDGEVVVSFDGAQPMALDLCDRHRKAVVQPLMDLVRLYGAKAGGPRVGAKPGPKPGAMRRAGKQPANGARPFQCLWCPADYAADSGLRTHVESAHGFGPGGMRTSYGTRCPVCGETLDALGSHGVRAHNAANVTQLFQMAKDDGDPFGVVAKRLRAGKKVTRTPDGP